VPILLVALFAFLDLLIEEGVIGKFKLVVFFKDFVVFEKF
jgi:hypothetical protein